MGTDRIRKYFIFFLGKSLRAQGARCQSCKEKTNPSSKTGFCLPRPLSAPWPSLTLKVICVSNLGTVGRIVKFLGGNNQIPNILRSRATACQFGNIEIIRFNYLSHTVCFSMSPNGVSADECFISRNVAAEQSSQARHLHLK